MGLLEDIKREAAKSGANRGKIFYLKDGQKARIRFLDDMDEGMELTFHDSYEKGINVPCQELFGRECDYCDDEELRTRKLYAWSIYDYESKQVKVMLYAVNNCTPVGAMMAMYETYGTITDRDYVFSVSGKGSDKTFTVVPMDKNKFRNAKVKALSDDAILDIIDKAYPTDDIPDDEEEPSKSKKSKKSDKSSANSKKSNQEETGEDEEGTDYSELSAKELYKLCKKRDIEVEPKKPAKYYINLLEEYDEAHDDWDEEGDDEDDEWED